MGQDPGVALVGDDRPNDLQPGHPGHVRQHPGQLQVHQGQGLLHPLDVLSRQADQVGPLADVVPQGVGGVVRLEDGRQQAVGVQALNPLAVPLVGLRPALDLAGEVGGGHGHREARLQEGEEQHMPVRPARLHRDGGDPTLFEPIDQLAQPGCVGTERADRVGPVGGGGDTDPVGHIADVDAGRVGVGHGRVGQWRGGRGRFGDVSRSGRRLLRRCGRGCGLASGHDVLHNGAE